MKFFSAIVAAAALVLVCADADNNNEHEKAQSKPETHGEEHAGARTGSIRGLQSKANKKNNGNSISKQHGGGIFNDLKANSDGKAIADKFRRAPRRGIPDQYIVVLEDSVNEQDIEAMADSLVRATGSGQGQRKGQAYRRTLKGFAARLTEADAISLSKRPEVQYVEQDAEVTASATWGIDRIDQRDLPLDGAYNPTGDGSGVTAYIIDTGIRVTHSEFGGRASWGVNYVGDSTDDDCNGHGTHVAGTVGGATYGVAKNVNLIAVKVLGCAGGGTWSGVLSGIEWVQTDCTGACVANMSLGGGQSSTIDNAVNAVVAAGIPFAVAAGNANASACSYSPAAAVNAITVGSTTISDGRSSFSNYGTCVDMFAPGSSITAAWINSDTSLNTISGTSMASPHVAGIAAIYLGKDPTLSWEAVTAKMTDSASPGRISSPGTGSPNLLAYVIDEPAAPTSAPPGPTSGPTPSPTKAPTPAPPTSAPFTSSPTNTPPAVDKYMCHKKTQSASTICLEGTTSPFCAPGTICGNGGKVCQKAECGGGTPPAPAPNPPGSCLTTGSRCIDGTCCNGCRWNGRWAGTCK